MFGTLRILNTRWFIKTNLPSQARSNYLSIVTQCSRNLYNDLLSFCCISTKINQSIWRCFLRRPSVSLSPKKNISWGAWMTHLELGKGADFFLLLGLLAVGWFVEVQLPAHGSLALDIAFVLIESRGKPTRNKRRCLERGPPVSFYIHSLWRNSNTFGWDEFRVSQFCVAFTTTKIKDASPKRHV